MKFDFRHHQPSPQTARDAVGVDPAEDSHRRSPATA
jgi:hypothetical protein